MSEPRRETPHGLPEAQTPAQLSETVRGILTGLDGAISPLRGFDGGDRPLSYEESFTRNRKIIRQLGLHSVGSRSLEEASTL